MMFEPIRAMIEAALAAVAPAGAVRRFLSYEDHHLRVGDTWHDLSRGRLFLLAGGKAAQPMAEVALEIVGDMLTAGIVIAKHVLPPPAGSKCHFLTASHPIPDERSLLATDAVITMLKDTRPGDLLLCLISGGMSALFTRPVIPLTEWQQLITALLHSGCPIHELNFVRQSLDLVKGGGLAGLATPAGCISLILSDVIGNPISFIGGGPTAFSEITPAGVLAILTRYQIDQQLPSATWQQIVNWLDNRPVSHPIHPPPRNLIIGDVGQAAQSAAEAANRQGFKARVLTTRLEGEAREVGRMAAALAWDAQPGECLILGGETTVTVRGSGRGGRNQELALAAAIALEGCPDALIATFATDGEDGPTDAAGAIISGRTIAEAQAQGLDPQTTLANNDSYNFFAALSPTAHIKTGPTATNVNDLLFILKIGLPDVGQVEDE